METIDFNAKKGFLCDMDGVIYHGNHILPGAAEFIHWLQDTHKEYLFLTNNSGMATVLVLSGVSTRATLDEFAYRPSVVLDGVGDIPRLAQQG